MAEATAQTETVVTGITLNLTVEEAQALYVLTGIVGGGWDYSEQACRPERVAAEAVYNALSEVEGVGRDANGRNLWASNMDFYKAIDRQHHPIIALKNVAAPGGSVGERTSG